MKALMVEPNKKKHRISAGVLCFISFLVLSLSIIYVYTSDVLRDMLDGIYLEMGTDISTERLSETVLESTANQLMEMLSEKGWKELSDFCEENDILYSIYTSGGRRMGGNLPVDMEEQATELLYHARIDQTGITILSSREINQEEWLRLKLILPRNWIHRVCMTFPRELGTPLKGGLIFSVMGIFAFFGFILSLSKWNLQFLGGLRKIPLEVYLALLWTGIFYARNKIVVYLEGLDLLNLFARVYFLVNLVVVYGAVLSLGLILGCMLRRGGYRHTLCFQLLRRVVCGVRHLGRMWMEALKNIPMVWKLSAVIVVITCLEAGALVYFTESQSGRLILLALWGLEKAVMIPLVIVMGIAFRKFRRMAKELSGGNLSYQMDSGYLPRIFRGFREDMNAVADSVNIAVEEKLKSQRFKTELISNVSHDLKTPLTSIINFSDLIAKEDTENPHIREYATHLYQQSVRLKKLLENLIEVSKASTGNLEVHMETCEMKVLLGQCLGEFEPMLGEEGLELVVRMEGEPVYVLADPQMLWRVFENLMTNVKKYALKNTRVFLHLEQEGDRAVVTVKNTSGFPLEDAPEELMERFTRGDKSRHTEGYGLGLSIVKSLMELMGGEIRLETDGDLFKVRVYFTVARKP